MGFLLIMPGLRKLDPALCPLSRAYPAWQLRGEEEMGRGSDQGLSTSAVIWAQLGTNVSVREEGCGVTSDTLPAGFKAQVPWGKDWPFCGRVRAGLQGFGSLGRAALPERPVMPPGGRGRSCRTTNYSPPKGPDFFSLRCHRNVHCLSRP